ncbi:MAG TPA: GNAT family N-acetyltransferase, partial [Hyphomonas sp.]|nr:GNAT family N-acetyltransferase [Hyphomonas sp.]
LACAPPSGPPTEVDLSSLSLRWILDDQLSAEEVRVGLDWNLGLLSALPPAGGEHLEITEDGEQLRILLHVEQAGFPERAEAALTDALQELRESEELAQTGAVDLGRLFMLTLHEPWRYYSISGACADYWAWSGARLPQARDRYDVVVSLIAPGERVVLLPEARGLGIGKALFAAAMDHAAAQGWPEVYLETTDGLGASMQLYLANGFTLTSDEPAELWHGPGRFIVMTRRLVP